MSLIICSECGKEFSDKASACPSCGCPTELMESQESDVSSYEDESFEKNESQSDSPNSVLRSARNMLQNAADNWKDSYRATRKVGPVKIDENHRVFQINGVVKTNGKKSGLMGKSFKGMMALSTAGISLAAEKALGLGGKKVGANEWCAFSDLISYELLEDDAIVTSGGVGQALIGGGLFGGQGAIAGAMTGKRVQKKRIESLYIKATLNNFKIPCVLIPLITKPIKTNSKEYQVAFEDAHKILSVLDVITHNK